MASSAITKAKNELQRMNSKILQARKRQKQEAAELTNGAAVLVGSAAAALLDEKFAESDGAVAKVGPVPTNALIGTAAVVGAFLVKKMPMRTEIAAGGLGMAGCALYNVIRENVDFTPEA